MLASRSGAAFAVMLWAATSAFAAGPSQSTVVAPGGFVSACASYRTDNFKLPVPGADMEREFFSYGHSCESRTFSGAGGIATVTANYTTSSSNGSAHGFAGMGLIQLTALEDATNAYPAPAAAGGGWTDRLKVSMPGQDGKAAVWLYQLWVSGNGFVSDPMGGNGGAARASVSGFKGRSLLSRSPGGWNAGTGTVGDGQTFSWLADANKLSFSVNELVTFAVPVTLGSQFDWGVYASVLARAPIGNGVSPHVFSQGIDFGHTIRYAGSAGVVINGVLYENESLTSASGIDWLQATPVPEPAPAVLALVGLAGLALRRFTAGRQMRS